MNMKKMAVGIFVLFAFVLTSQMAQADAIKIKIVGTLPLGHHLTDALYKFKTSVESKAPGKVVVDVFPAQQLYNDKDLVQVLPRGNVDMALANMDMWTGLLPVLGFAYMPMLFDDEDHFYRTVRGKTGQIVDQELQKKNCRCVGWANYGAVGYTLSRTSISKMADFKGKRIRSYGQMSSYFIQALGGSPTMMSSGEVYDAIQRGALDGVCSGLQSMSSRKWYEQAKFIADANSHPVFVYMLVANNKFWNKLPEDVKKAVTDSAKALENDSITNSRREEKVSRDILEKNGVKFVPVSKKEFAQWRAAAMPILTDGYKKHYKSTNAQVVLSEVEKNRK